MQKKLIAEFIGTLVLSMGVLWSVSTAMMFTPLLAAVILALMVYLIGWLSGCHINPAVTLGLLSIKKIKPDEAVYYVLVQLAAGAGAMVLASGFGLTMPAVTMPEMQGFLMEFLGMTLFTFGIGMVVAGKVHEAMSGAVVGLSLFLGIVMAAMGGAAGILNPAVGVALGTTVIGYYVVSIVGGVLGFQLAHYLAEKKHWWQR